ncbi:hypothetical protein EYF80_033382 [Liparis tanakae]|uniref:Uncharacterized protein n=1 Tax=Liparis tanakae TaxID=230148 RepID=A0A4Z2GSY4_9TELE|nr:hypothetical protein EYF80_033382 [Liparis tanakae]
MPFPAAQPPQREARPGAQLARLGGASRQAHGAQPAQGPLPSQTCPGRDGGMRDQEGKREEEEEEGGGGGVSCVPYGVWASMLGNLPPNPND